MDPGKIWRYNLADFDRAVELLESIERENLLSNSDPRLYWSTWKHYFLQIMDISNPHITVNTKKFGSIPWINTEYTCHAVFPPSEIININLFL